MLTAETALPVMGVGAGYWCEVTARTGIDHALSLGYHLARNSRLALRWLRNRAQDVTDQLDLPYTGPGRHWLTDMAEHERALAILAQGRPYAVTFSDDTSRYVLTISPAGSTR